MAEDLSANHERRLQAIEAFLDEKARHAEQLSYTAHDPGPNPAAAFWRWREREPVPSWPIVGDCPRIDETVVSEKPGRVGLGQPNPVDKVGLEALGPLPRHDHPPKGKGLFTGEESERALKPRRQVWRDRLSAFLKRVLSYRVVVEPAPPPEYAAPVAGTDHSARLQDRPAQMKQVASQEALNLCGFVGQSTLLASQGASRLARDGRKSQSGAAA